jgi:hypothetical protein
MTGIFWGRLEQKLAGVSLSAVGKLRRDKQPRFEIDKKSIFCRWSACRHSSSKSV